MTSTSTSDITRYKHVFAPLIKALNLPEDEALNVMNYLYGIYCYSDKLGVIVQDGHRVKTVDDYDDTDCEQGVDYSMPYTVYGYDVTHDCNDNITAITPHIIHYTPAPTEYTKVDLPTWALCYLINGDTDNLTDEDKQTVDKWLESVNNVVGPVMPTTIMDGEEPEPSPYFRYCPAFGPGADCEEYFVVFKEGQE